jgi:hypothetical protein
MAPARQQLMTARETERFPTEWALYDSDKQAGEQALHESEDDRPGGRAPTPTIETIKRPARRSERLDWQIDGAA